MASPSAWGGIELTEDRIATKYLTDDVLTTSS